MFWQRHAVFCLRSLDCACVGYDCDGWYFMQHADTAAAHGCMHKVVYSQIHVNTVFLGTEHVATCHTYVGQNA